MRDQLKQGKNIIIPFTQKTKNKFFQGGETKLMKMNKVLASLLVVALLISLVAPSFAGAAMVDINDDSVATAVERLKNFEIMEGYPDGTFKPDNTITRAEFAKIAVVAMGLGDAAAISAGSTLFKDVAADSWASGYINVASSQGLIVGFPDGTYKPNEEITYAQALTILVRLIGYGPVLDGKPWPQAYVTKAAEAGVTKGITTLAPSADAARGLVARLLNNTLDAKLLEIASYNANGEPLYTVSNTKTLLTEKLDVTRVKTATEDEFVVTNTPVLQSTAVVGDTTLAAAGGYKFASFINPDQYLGLKVKAWVANSGTNKGKIVSIETVTASSDIYEGVIKAGNDGKIELAATKAKYASTDVAAGGEFYLNNVNATSFAGFTAALGTQDMAQGRAIIKDGKLMSVYATSAKNAGNVNTFVVKEIRDEVVRSEFGGIEVNLKTLKEDVAKKNKRVAVVKNGEAATLDDIVVGDVVTRIVNTDFVQFIVTNNVVAGELASVSGTAVASAKLQVAGSSYEIALYNSMSFDAGKNYNKSFADIKDVVGKDVKLVLNHVGEVVALVSESAKTTYNYAVVIEKIGNVSTADGLKDFVKVFTTAGETVTLSVESKDAATYAAVPAAGVGFEYQMTADGEIKKSSVKALTAIANVDYTRTVATAGGTAFTGTPNKVLSDLGTTKLVTSDTVIINVNNPAKPKIVSFENVKDVAAITASAGVINDILFEGAIAKVVIINTTAVSASTDAIVVGTGIDKDGETITLFAKGALKTYKVTNGSIPTAAKNGILVDFSTNTDGKVDASTITALSSFVYSNLYRVVEGVDTANSLVTVKGIGSDKLETGAKQYFSIHKDVVVYDVTASKTAPVVKSLSDINQYNYIWVRTAGNGQVDRIVDVLNGVSF